MYYAVVYNTRTYCSLNTRSYTIIRRRDAVCPLLAIYIGLDSYCTSLSGANPASILVIFIPNIFLVTNALFM